MVDENRWGIIYCPKNGLLSNPVKKWEQAERCLEAHHIQYDMVQSEHPRSVERLTMMMINNGYKTIVIFGGDSALNDAVNCLMSLEPAIRESISLGVIPNGVINDFAHFWGFDEYKLEQTIEWLSKRRVRKVDLGCIRYRNRKEESCHRYFLNCVNAGLVATIMGLRRRTRHLFVSRTLSFIFSSLLLLFQRVDFLMHLHIDTEDIKRRLMTVCIGNALGYGQTPSAVPYNGLLDVSVVSQPKTLQTIEGLYLLLRGRILNHKGVRAYRTKELELQVDEHTPVSVDGRLLNGTPVGVCKLSVKKEVLNFLIPDLL